MHFSDCFIATNILCKISHGIQSCQEFTKIINDGQSFKVFNQIRDSRA